MCPAVFSTKRKEKKNVGWMREGTEVNYFKSNIQKEKLKEFYYTLSF
jgi:hypothetical protein